MNTTTYAPTPPAANTVICESEARALALALGVSRDHGVAARVVATPCGRWRVEADEAAA